MNPPKDHAQTETPITNTAQNKYSKEKTKDVPPDEWENAELRAVLKTVLTHFKSIHDQASAKPVDEYTLIVCKQAITLLTQGKEGEREGKKL